MLILYLIFTIYLALFCFFAWQIRKSIKPAQTIEKPFISILIPIKNEEQRIEELLNSLNFIEYPKDSFEILFWDDGSSDASFQFIEEFRSLQPQLTIEVRKEPVSIGKKKIIQKAAGLARGNWVLLSDADTRFGPQRLQSFADSCSDSYDIIIGDVQLTGNSLLESFQAFEYSMMMNISQASANAHNPILGSSANLMFRKEAFIEAGAFDDNLEQNSGDDVFLINCLKKLRKNNILFLKDEAAAVYTHSESDFKNFIRQRIRWASKNPYVKDRSYQFVAWTTLVINLLLVLIFLKSLFSFDFTDFFKLYTLKLISDLILYSSSARQQKKSYGFLVFFSLVYPFYVTFIGLASFVIRPKWR